MIEKQFFEKQTASSKVKASIVSEYFPKYCKIIVSKNKPKAIRYIDLFAGPGYYEDGNPSTPILIGKHCKNNDFLRENVEMYFNDKEFADILKDNFCKEFPDGTFKHKPYFADRTVGEEERITAFLRKNTMNLKGKNDYPSLLFIDPFGYKGIETSVLSEFLTFWGNEIFLFVNTKRIQPALENEKFEPLMKDLFPTTFDKVKNDIKYKSNVSERLQLIIDNLGQEYIKKLGNHVYYTAFKFKEEDIDATSHYILHFTKGSRGFDLIKTIYNDFANVGTVFDGNNTYTFDAKLIDSPNDDMFDLNSENIDKLKKELYCTYTLRKITAKDLFEEHQVNSLYSKSHYTEALRKLENEKKLTSVFTDKIKHNVTVLISDYCLLEFK